MLILTGTHFRSTDDPRVSEWTACDRPLGVWATLWVLRVILASILAYWDYLRNRTLTVRLSVGLLSIPSIYSIEPCIQILGY